MADGKRGRDSDSDSSSSHETDKDDAPLVQQPVAAALQDEYWMMPSTSLEYVVNGVTEFMHNQGLICKARVRSSDKTRATIACKHQPSGCPLRLTVKKGFAPGQVLSKYVTPNLDSFVCGTCTATPGPPPLSTLVKPARPPAHVAAAALPAAQAPPPSLQSAAAGQSCNECNDPAVIACTDGEHHWCADCLTTLATSQLEDKPLFIARSCKYLCPYDGSEINEQRVCGVVTPAAFQLTVRAYQEQAIVDTQKACRLQVSSMISTGIPV